MKYLAISLLMLMQLACSSDSNPSADPGAATEFYVDSISGNDSNDGTSANTAWRSFTNIATTNFVSNTTIYLKRNSIWYEQLTVPVSNLNIDAYGTGNLPAINGSLEVSGWASLGSNFYSKTITPASGEALGNISEDDIMMKFAAWDDDYTTSLSGAADGSFTFDYPNNTIYIKVSSDPALKTYRASIKIYGINVENKSNVTIKNVSISNFSLLGVNFKNCNTCSITDSSISNGGGAVLQNLGVGSSPDYLYAGNGVEFGNSSTNGAASSLTISKIFDSGLSPQTYASNQTAGPFTFSNNTISECGFAGIEISVLDNNGTTNSTINTVAMSGNTISSSGKGWSGQRYGSEGYGIRVKADDGAGSISGVSLTTSEITNSVNSGVKLAGDINVVTISRSKFYSNDNHGVDVETTASSLRLDMSVSQLYANGGYGFRYNSNSAAGFNILHNTFYNNTTTNFGVITHAGVAKIQNNIFTSNTGLNDIYVAGTLSSPTVNNNCYSDHMNMFNYNGGSLYSTVALFSGDTGFEINGTGSGTIGLSNPGSGDFTISAGSSCDGLGDASLGVTSDYAGNAYANPPASGAYEAQ